MPGIVEDYARRQALAVEQTKRGFENGRRFMEESLSRQFGRVKQTLAQNIGFVKQQADGEIAQRLAINASHAMNDNWGDRGRGPERIETQDYERGQREAIRAFAHRHNPNAKENRIEKTPEQIAAQKEAGRHTNEILESVERTFALQQQQQERRPLQNAIERREIPTAEALTRALGKREILSVAEIRALENTGWKFTREEEEWPLVAEDPKGHLILFAYSSEAQKNALAQLPAREVTRKAPAVEQGRSESYMLDKELKPFERTREEKQILFEEAYRHMERVEGRGIVAPEIRREQLIAVQTPAPAPSGIRIDKNSDGPGYSWSVTNKDGVVLTSGTGTDIHSIMDTIKQTGLSYETNAVQAATKPAHEMTWKELHPTPPAPEKARKQDIGIRQEVGYGIGI